jgi:hypothetical protein
MIKRVLFPPLNSVLESNFYLLYCSISYRSESGFNRVQFNRNEDKTIHTKSGRTLKDSSSKMFTMEKYSLWYDFLTH